jgi:uncharacterized protein YecE (DUF72 family)
MIPKNDVETLRKAIPQWVGTNPDQYTDAELAEIATNAKRWVGGRRYSWVIVACNYMRTGEYKA